MDFYFGPMLEKDTEANTEDAKTEFAAESRKNEELIFYIDQVTGIQWLCILSKATDNIIAIVYRNGHLGFSKYYKTIIKL